MGENSKYQTLSQELIRRFMNTSNGLPEEEYWQIIDNYADKLKNSGYKLEQIRRIVLAGAKGYGAKKLRCEESGKTLRRTAEESQGARMRNKLIGKSTWFKTKKEAPKNQKDGSNKGAGNKRVKEHGSTPSTVLFVEQTPGGELA